MGELSSFGLNGHVPLNRVWFGGVLNNTGGWAFVVLVFTWCTNNLLEFGWGEGKKGLAPIVQKVDSEALLEGLRVSLVWISKPVVWRIEKEAMSLLAFSHCTCAFVCCWCSFNPSLCCLSPFLLSHVTLSSPCCLSEFYPKRASIVLSTC